MPAFFILQASGLLPQRVYNPIIMRQDIMETTTKALDEQRLGQGTRSPAETIAADDARVQETAPAEDSWERNTRKVAQYLSENVPEFRRLSALRQKV